MPALPVWLYPYLGAFLIGVSKAGFATGLGMLTTPLLATAVPPRQAIGIILPLLCCADLVTLSAFWKKWDLKLVRYPFIGAMVGVGLGMLLVNSISEHLLRVTIGATALVLTVLLLIRNVWFPTRTYAPGTLQSLLVGVAAGFASTLAHGAGPIMVLFLMAQRVDKKIFIATNAIFFTALNLIKVPPYVASGLITRFTLIQDLRYLPMIPLGVFVGWLANRALPKKAFEILVYVLLLITSVQLLAG